MYEAGLPRLRRAGRKAFAAAVANILNLFEMSGSVYSCIIIDRKFARMYVLSSGRVAVEFSTAGELVNLDVPIQGRGGLSYSQILNMDLHAALAQRLTGDELSPRQPDLMWTGQLGDQFCRDSVIPEDRTPREKFDGWETSADHAGLQSYVDFMAAGVVRLGAVNADVPITEKLPTPVQDSLDAEIPACLVQKGVPMELAIAIRDESRRPKSLSTYLDFSAEEQQSRPESKGLWRRMVQHWRDGFDPRWDYFPEITSSNGAASDENESSDGSGSGSGAEASTDAFGNAGGTVGEENGGNPGSDADDESESDRQDFDDGSSDSHSALSTRTRQWIHETGSDPGNTEAHATDWRTFDPWADNDEPEEDDIGYSSWSAENDWYEAKHNLECDTRHVLSITERVLQELCRIVPVTKAEMDELVQTQYELDLARYK